MYGYIDHSLSVQSCSIADSDASHCSCLNGCSFDSHSSECHPSKCALNVWNNVERYSCMFVNVNTYNCDCARFDEDTVNCASNCQIIKSTKKSKLQSTSTSSMSTHDD